MTKLIKEERESPPAVPKHRIEGKNHGLKSPKKNKKHKRSLNLASQAVVKK